MDMESNERSLFNPVASDIGRDTMLGHSRMIARRIVATIVSVALVLTSVPVPVSAQMGFPTTGDSGKDRDGSGVLQMLTPIAPKPEGPASIPNEGKEAPSPELSAEGEIRALAREFEMLAGPKRSPISDLAGSLPNIESAVAWTGAHIRLVAYRGHLKSPEAVLRDHDANSLDRSLLLARVLQTKGYETRLALFDLERPIAIGLIAAMTRRHVTALTPASARPSEGELRAMADRIGVDNELLRKLADQQARAAIIAGKLREAEAPLLVADIVERSSRALASGQAARVAILERFVEAMSRHWAVEVRDGDNWRVLDPDGLGLDEMTREDTIDPSRIPAAERHRVVVTLKATFESGTRTLIERVGNASELDGKSIAIEAEPLDLSFDYSLLDRGIDPLQLARSAALARLTEAGDRAVALAETDAWRLAVHMPVKDSPNARTVTRNGQIFDTYELSNEIRSRSTPSGILGRRLPGVADLGAKPADRLLAVTLRIETRLGSDVLQSAERLVLRVAASKPFFSSLSSTYQVETAKTGPGDAERAIAKLLRDGLEGAIQSGEGKPELLAGVLRSCGACYSYQAGRWLHAARDDLFLAQPNLSGIRRGLGFFDSDWKQALEIFDVVFNSVETPVSSDSNPIISRLQQGVNDMLAESDLGDQTTPGGIRSLLREPDRWRLLVDGDPMPEAIAKTAASAGIVQQALEGGKVVMAQTGDGSAPEWVEIDPQNGSLLLRMGHGEGGEQVGYIVAAVATIGCYGAALVVHHYDLLRDDDSAFLKGVKATGACVVAGLALMTGVALGASAVGHALVIAAIGLAVAAAAGHVWSTYESEDQKFRDERRRDRLEDRVRSNHRRNDVDDRRHQELEDRVRELEDRLANAGIGPANAAPSERTFEPDASEQARRETRAPEPPPVPEEPVEVDCSNPFYADACAAGLVNPAPTTDDPPQDPYATSCQIPRMDCLL